MTYIAAAGVCNVVTSNNAFIMFRLSLWEMCDLST